MTNTLTFTRASGWGAEGTAIGTLLERAFLLPLPSSALSCVERTLQAANPRLLISLWSPIGEGEARMLCTFSGHLGEEYLTGASASSGQLLSPSSQLLGQF